MKQNKIKNSCYLYRHIRLDNLIPFYVGIGSDLNFKRAYNLSSRNKHWHNIVKKTAYRVEILLKNLTWEEACKKEYEFIKIHGRSDLGKGTLCNKTNGGEGTFGFIFTTNSKIKMSDSRKKYFSTPFAIEKNRNAQKKAYSNIDLRNKQRDIRLKIFENNDNLRQIISEKTREAMKRPEVVEKVFKSKGISQRTHDFRKKMNLVALNRTEEHKENLKKSISLAMKRTEVRAKIRESLSIKVNQFDLNGNLMKEWDSMSKASDLLKIDRTSIGRCCKNKQNQAGGFKWTYKII